MQLHQKTIIFVAGPNGAGKTSSAYSILPNFFQTNEFVNADEIARGLSPLNQSSVAIQAGKIMIQRIDTLMQQEKSFGIETTLSGKRYEKLIGKAKSKGYQIGMIFLYLSSIELAKKRVQERVRGGGHHIPNNVIDRRYKRGLNNLIQVYLPLLNWAYIFDNSSQDESQGPIPVYFQNGDQIVYNERCWKEIHEQVQ